MDRTEILQFNVKIAQELMNWERADEFATSDAVWELHEDRDVYFVYDYRVVHLYKHGAVQGYARFQPDQYIDDAWMLMKRIREIDPYWCPGIYWDDDDGLSAGYWVAYANYYAETTEQFKAVDADDENECMAICKMALKLVNLKP